MTGPHEKLAMAVAVVLWTTPAKGDDVRDPLPEPVLQETTTDIDGDDPGEVEVEATGSMLRSRKGGAFDGELSLEIEALLTRRLGAKVEPFFERTAIAGDAAQSSAGMGAGASWKIVQDFAHDFYVQAEAAGVIPAETSSFVQPGESPLPFTGDLRSGFRRGPLTLRNSLGFSAGGTSAHAPIRGSAVVLTDFESGGRFGFWGVEVEADGARANPFLVALDVVPNLTPVGLPFALGFVLPYSIGAAGSLPSYGLLVRIYVESQREQDYARPEPDVPTRATTRQP
jgi:hypothetical protein